MSILYLTGANGALGRSISEHFRSLGWKIAGFDHAKHESSLDFSTQVNLQDYSETKRAFVEAAANVGRPDALICTVGGVSSWNTIDNVSFEDFEKLIRLNLYTAFNAMKSGFELMKERGGAILTIGAEAGINGEAKKSGYGASKAALINLTESVAQEGKEFGISANCIVPKVIHTKANEEWGSAEDIPKWTHPNDIANLCAHLASPAGRSITGSVIRIPNRL